MKYNKALGVLPENLIEIIQQYIDGGYIYIPRKLENQKSWGETSGIKYNLQIRNSDIYNKHLNGYSIYDLSNEFFLSEQSIRRILNQQKEYSHK